VVVYQGWRKMLDKEMIATYFSMFSGIGGFELGIRHSCDARIKERKVQEDDVEYLSDPGSENSIRGEQYPMCVGHSEIDKHAIQIYQKHFKGHKNYGDATRIIPEEIPDFDLLVGGFPCQAFSIAGKRRGFKDTRGTLFFEIARIAKAKKPMYMLLENVKGLISHDKGKSLEIILETLQELGYCVNIEIHNSKNFGVPQNRERIFFLCRHIQTIIRDGQNKKIDICGTTIQEYLFQLLLNNLKEVQELQEHNLKDWIVGYLICREINQNLKSKDKNTKDGITIPMGYGLFQSREEEVWQNIDTWLKNHWEENYLGKSKFTISTVIKKIISWETYSYSKLLASILLAIVLLRNLSKDSWEKVLSSLILIKEDTKYARINNQIKGAIITESGSLHLPQYLQDFRRYFIIGHLRETSRPEVFPIREGYQKPIKQNAQRNDIAHTITNTDKHRGSYIESDILQGLSDRGPRIRRLTPTECEFLQGFSKNYTKQGVIDYANAEKKNALKALQTLWQEVGAGKGEGRGFTKFIPLLKKEILRQELHESELQGEMDFRSFETTRKLSCQAVGFCDRMLNLWEEEGLRHPPQRQRQIKQHLEQLAGVVSKLPYEVTQERGWVEYRVAQERFNGKVYSFTGISDTQRYKCLGNAVTVNVIQAIVERLNGRWE